MHATPITYYDNPLGNIKYLESLDETQTEYFMQGYIQACNHVLESLSDTKRKFLSAALDTPEENRSRLLAHVKLLDFFDDALKQRLLQLEDKD